MTKEKAVEVLKRSQKIISPISPLYEAIGVALEQLDAGATDTDAGDKSISCVHENDLISRQPDKDKVSNLLYHIYSIQSPHLDMNGVIAKKYYCEELWKELFGKESELPRWMN